MFIIVTLVLVQNNIPSLTVLYMGRLNIISMMTPSNGNNFRVTGPLCGEFIGHQWIPLTKASDAKLWCFLWSVPEVNNRDAGDLRRHRSHYDVIVVTSGRWLDAVMCTSRKFHFMLSRAWFAVWMVFCFQPLLTIVAGFCEIRFVILNEFIWSTKLIWIIASHTNFEKTCLA